MPYIYSLAGMTWFNDYTMMRALVMDFPRDKNVVNISDQYMFGPAIMACPVYEYKARSREVYFPDNEGWYDLFTGDFIEGGQTLTVNAPYDKMPLYAASGSIIPYGPEMMYSNEKQAEEITLYVYAGKDGSFTLYEDEEVNYNYEDGEFANITFVYNDADKTLEIGDRQGDFAGMLKERAFNIVYVNEGNPVALDFDTEGIVVEYNGVEQTISLSKQEK